MQILTGTKREITLSEWSESLNKTIETINNHAKCFELYHDEDSVNWIIEDLPKLSEQAEAILEVIEYCNKNNIK